MKTVRCLTLILMAFAGVSLRAQQLAVVHTHSAHWTCEGETWVLNSDIFCKNLRSFELAKFLISGQQVFPKLEAPPVGRSTHIVALNEDGAHNIYALDGLHIHIYSPDGKYKTSIDPGINIGIGIAVLDAQHIFVTGRVPEQRGQSAATVFAVGPEGVQRSFSDVFFKDVSGLADRVLNFASSLALDRTRGLLYQLPQGLYEIRVFTLAGDPVRTIVPPAVCRIKRPQLHAGNHPPNNGLGVEPGDGLENIAVLPDGGLAVLGAKLDSMQKEGSKAMVSYSTFLDVYGPSGDFRRRFTNAELHKGGAHFLGLDQLTGKAYFARSDIILETEVR